MLKAKDPALALQDLAAFRAVQLQGAMPLLGLMVRADTPITVEYLAHSTVSVHSLTVSFLCPRKVNWWGRMSLATAPTWGPNMQDFENLPANPSLEMCRQARSCQSSGFNVVGSLSPHAIQGYQNGVV